MSLTSEQKLLVDETISVYIENFDKIAIQYLNLRRTILSLDETNSEPYQIKQLQYELEKLKQLYVLHLESLDTNREVISQIPSVYVTQLSEQFDNLNDLKVKVIEEIDNLKNIQKPLLDNIRVLLKGFRDTLDSRISKNLYNLVNTEQLITATTQNEFTMDTTQLVFEQSDLDEIFDSVHKRFKKKKVDGDEIMEGTEEDSEEADVDDIRGGLDVQKYVDEYLESDKALKKRGDRYVYDIRTKVENHGAGVADYDQMIDAVMNSIEDLIDSGVEAKERWSSNALKLDIIKEALRED